MGRFLLTVWPFSGHLHPNMAVALALRARGHDVAFYTGARAKSVVDSEDFRLFPFTRVSDERVHTIVSTLGGATGHRIGPLEQMALWREWLLGTVPDQLADLTEVLGAWRPDIVVCDPAMWGPFLVLHETRRIPVAVMSYTASCLVPGPEGPILGLPWPRPHSRLTRLRARLARSVATRLGSDIRRRASRLRQRYGLAALPVSVTEFAARMPLYLVPSVPEFDYQRRDLPTSVHYVGPCPWDRGTSDLPPEWLIHLPPDRPVVYITEGTLAAPEPFLLKAALAGLADLPVLVVATTGKNRDPSSLREMAKVANARVEQWVPQSDLLPHVDVVVTTGGSGTVMGALARGIPLVIVPTAWDQPENAWRVAECGVGLRIARRDCTPSRLRMAVLRVLDEPAFGRNAAHLAAAMNRFGGPRRAAELLETLLIPAGEPVSPRSER